MKWLVAALLGLLLTTSAAALHYDPDEPVNLRCWVADESFRVNWGLGVAPGRAAPCWPLSEDYMVRVCDALSGYAWPNDRVVSADQRFLWCD